MGRGRAEPPVPLCSGDERGLGTPSLSTPAPLQLPGLWHVKAAGPRFISLPAKPRREARAPRRAAGWDAVGAGGLGAHPACAAPGQIRPGSGAAGSDRGHSIDLGNLLMKKESPTSKADGRRGACGGCGPERHHSRTHAHRRCSDESGSHAPPAPPASCRPARPARGPLPTAPPVPQKGLSGSIPCRSHAQLSCQHCPQPHVLGMFPLLQHGGSRRGQELRWILGTSPGSMQRRGVWQPWLCFPCCLWRREAAPPCQSPARRGYSS